MDYQEQSKKLGGPIALLKYQVTRTGTLIADESVQAPARTRIRSSGVDEYIRHFW